MSESNSNDRGSDSEGKSADGATPTEIDSGTGVGDRGDRGRDPRDDSTQVANEERRRNVSFISAFVAVMGGWVALSVFIYDVGNATLWNNVLVGTLVFLAGTYNYFRLSNDTPLSVGATVLVAVLGIWLIVSPALLEAVDSLYWSTLIPGVVVTGLAVYNAYDAREARSAVSDPGTESETR